jgi:hypothetical protein
MGFTINEYKLLGVPLQNVYVSIKARYYIMNSNFMYGIQNKYQITSDYWFSVTENSPTVEFGTVIINTDFLPADIYYTIYEKIKSQIDPKYGTPEATLVFTDVIHGVDPNNLAQALRPIVPVNVGPTGPTESLPTTPPETTLTTPPDNTPATPPDTTPTTPPDNTPTTPPDNTPTTPPDTTPTTLPETTLTTSTSE